MLVLGAPGPDLAGAGFGACFIPRIGQEVLVRFLEGNPDRPLIVGAVYNGTHPPPVALPGEKTKSTTRSDSSPGSGGANELRIEDTAGSEEVFVHAQKDDAIEILNDKSQSVGKDESLSVAKDRSRAVEGDHGLAVKEDDEGAVGGNQALTVLGDRTTTVDGDHVETVGVAQAVTIGGEQNVSVTQAASVTVGLGAALSVGGAYAVNVGIDHNTLVGGARLEEVGGLKEEVVGLHREERVAGDKSLTVGGEVVEQVDGGVTRATEGDEEQVAERVELAAAEFAQFVAKGIQIEATESFVVNVGGARAFEMHKSGEVKIFGKAVSIEGDEVLFRAPRIDKTRAAGRSRSAGVATADDPAPAGDAEVDRKIGTTIYRVQGGLPPNASRIRFVLDDAGKLGIQGDDMLFINLGRRGRALEFLARRGDQAVLVEFQVNAEFVQQLRSQAVGQRLGRLHPGRPQIVDPTRAPDQYGIPPGMFEDLLTNVVPGTVKVGRP